MWGGYKTTFIFYDTGLEYEATKEHLCNLEKKYGIKIERCKAIKSVPLSCKEYGIPFRSKFVSEMMERLQRHNFQWEDDTVDNLLLKYPRTSSAMHWWCNVQPNGSNTKQYIISHNPYLKEFIMESPPEFKVSNKCCKFAKKETSKVNESRNGYDLIVTGIRKNEGGARSMGHLYSSCFARESDGRDHYYPILWFLNKDKEQYEEAYNISHSKCYTEYGLKRTGCVGCPFAYMKPGKVLEVDVARQFEPKLAKAIENVFGESYEYTRKYMEFREKMKKV